MFRNAEEKWPEIPLALAAHVDPSVVVLGGRMLRSGNNSPYDLLSLEREIMLR